MGWAMKLLVMCMLGLAACQQRSISGSGSGRRRQRVPAGKSEVVNFNCPEDFGYYPHPSDCTQYYVCVFGGALQESCTGGLVYSHELQTCDWPRNVVCNLSSAGSGVSTVRITDPRTQNTSPVRAATEPLTPSVGSFDVRFSDSQTSRASDAVSVFDGSNKTIRQPKILSQKSDPQQSVSRFSQQPFFDTAVQESTSRPVRLTTDRTPVFPPQSSFKVGITSRPVSRPAPTLPPVEDPFYTADNWTDADYFYYYDDLLYDYYDNFPAVSTTTEAPVRQPLATSTPVRIRTGSSSFSSSSPSTTKSFSRGVATRGPASRFSSSSSPSSSLRAASSQSSSASRGSSASQSSRGGQTQLFEFSNLDLDSARAHFSSSSSSSSPSQRPSSLQSQSLRKSQQLTSSTQSRSRTKSRSRGRAHPSRVQANPPRSSQSQSPPILSASQALRISPGFPQTKESSPKSNPSASSSSFPPFRSPSSSSSSSSSASSTSSSSSRAPSLSQSSSRQPTRTSSSSSNRGSQRASSASSGPVTVDSSVPKRSRRPTLKPVSVVAPSSPAVGQDIWRYPPKRPNPTRSQPPVDTKATRCDPKICRLPDCYCGGKEVPGGIQPKNVPQMVLLTFDDSVNDLNKGLYKELFENGRQNPNGCPIVSTMYVSHEWTDYSQVQNLYADGHEMASHSIQHSFGEQFSIKKWAKEIAGQREILAAYGGVKMEDVRGMRAPFLAVGGNKMFKMLYDQNFTYDSSMPVYENKPPSWPYTLDYKIFHDCMIPPCPTNSYPGVWEVPMVMWQDLNGGRCSMGDACTTPPDAEGVYKMLIKNFERHYTSNRAPFGLFYHAAWFTTPHHKEGFIAFLDTITAMDDVWLITNHQLLQWMRDPQPLSTVKNFPAFGCNFPDRKKCTSTKVCNVWHKGGVRYMRTCQQCPEKYPWTGNTGIRSPLNDI